MNVDVEVNEWKVDESLMCIYAVHISGRLAERRKSDPLYKESSPRLHHTYWL